MATEVELLDIMLGCRIISIDRKLTWDKKAIESITLTVVCSQATHKIEITAHTDKGCSMCDPDPGVTNDYLSFEICKQRPT